MPKLIFIEGVSGVGKSTLVKRLADELSAKGRNVRAYVEFDFANPIDFYCTAYLYPAEYARLRERYPSTLRAIPAGEVSLVRYYNEDTPLYDEPLLSELAEKEFCYHPKRLVPLSEYTEAYRHVWKNFADGIDAACDYFIFDGSLLHHPINDMMRNYDVSGRQALAHVSALIGALGNLERTIFYLKTPDIGAQLNAAHISRDQNPPTCEEIAFGQRRYENDMYALERLTEETHIYDVSGNRRDWVNEQILRRF